MAFHANFFNDVVPGSILDYSNQAGFDLLDVYENFENFPDLRLVTKKNYNMSKDAAQRAKHKYNLPNYI